MEELRLQLFADDEIDGEEIDEELEVNEEELEDDDEEIDEEIDEESEDDDEEIDEEEPKQLDKKTKSIIKHKKQNKELREQLRQAQEKLQEVELEKESSQRVTELTQNGMSANDAKSMADKEIETKKLKIKLTTMELERLEDRYPGISGYSKQLAEDKEKLPEFSYEQLYIAKYANKSKFDQRTQLEQELAYKNKLSRDKSLETSNVKSSKSVKLSAEDERVYRVMKESMPNLTKKKFVKLMETDTLE